MTEHDHMPPIRRYTARYLSPGKITVQIQNGLNLVLTWAEASDLAESILEALTLERP